MQSKQKLRKLDAPIYSYWSALYMSFYSNRLYIDVGKRWHGFGILYLLLLVAIACIPFTIKMSGQFEKLFNQKLLEPMSLIPMIYIQNGEASFDKRMPYFIKNNMGEVVVIVDTTGIITKIPEAYPHVNILINKNAIVLKIPKPQLFDTQGAESNIGTDLVKPFGKRMNFVLDGKKIVEDKSIQRLKYFSQLMLYPVFVALFYSMLLVFFLALGFLGQVFARIFFSFFLPFKQSIRLFMVATTPMMFFALFIVSFNLIFLGFRLTVLLLLVGYFSFAVYSLRSESKQLV